MLTAESDVIGGTVYVFCLFVFSQLHL